MRFFRRKAPKALVLGLDCASPTLIFETFRAELPNLNALMQRGQWGVMRSSVPCITIPAWASMMTSHDAGELGVYGFRNRASYDYDALITADNHAVKFPRVWDILSTQEKQSIIANVPQTYPIKPLNGALISDFTTPNTASAFTYPPIIKNEVLKLAPDYAFDAGNFRTQDKAQLLQRIYDMTETQYRVFEHQLKTRQWDFAMHVNIGVDRVHHGFWRYHDPQHRLYTPNNPYQHAIRDYYRFVDEWIGRLLAYADDQTAVLVVSDHGVKRMDGAIAINQWLWQMGWLVLKETPQEGVMSAFSVSQVDWTRTRAWSTGGYYGRIFLNVCGREPHGIIPLEEVESVLEELTAQLEMLTDSDGERLPIQAFRPREIYRAVNGYAPDLIVYFGNLNWRAVGGFGYETHYTLDNDTGPDDANHAEEGMFIWANPSATHRGAIADRQLMDVAPTLLGFFGIQPLPDMQGQSF